MKPREETNTPRTDAAKDLWESPYRLYGEGEDGWATAAKFEVELAAAQQKLEQAEAEIKTLREWQNNWTIFHQREVGEAYLARDTERKRAEQAERRADEAEKVLKSQRCEE